MANRKSQKNNRNNQKRYANSSKRVSAHEGLKGKSPQGILDDQSARKWLIRGGVLITLVMWFSLNDPFNSPKSWFLSIIGFGLLGWLFFNFKKFIKDKTLRIATAITLIFGSTLTLAWILTDNKFIGFFGQYGRKTGLLEYICLLVFFLTASYLIRLKSIKLIEQAMVFLGLVLGIYGIFQHFQIDFVKWNYQYNSILGTLGNPDFAGAMMAILLVFNFGIVMNRTKWDRFRILSLINIPLLLIVILFSQVRQGLLAAAVGISLVTLVIIRQRNKNIAISLWGITIVAGIAVVAGLLKFGPLTKYFYKISVTYRGDYWRAAVRMFAHHPFFGVGLDRYGAYFRQYRDITQTLRRGPAVVADAAHNVPLQLAATGGVFVLLAFLVFTGFTIWRGIAALQKTTGQEQIIVAIFFGTWITYQAQSMISIDNLGIAIWGYLLGGCLVGLSISHQDFDSQPHGPKVGQILTSGLLGLIFVIISFLP